MSNDNNALYDVLTVNSESFIIEHIHASLLIFADGAGFSYANQFKNTCKLVNAINKLV